MSKIPPQLIELGPQALQGLFFVTKHVVSPLLKNEKTDYTDSEGFGQARIAAAE
jgi:hypothetical protein